MGLLDTKAQEAYLIYEITRIGPIDQKDLRLYTMMETFDWRYLPDAGGLRQQNAALMDRLMKIRRAYQIFDELNELQEKAESGFKKKQGFSEAAVRVEEEMRKRLFG